MLEFLLERDIEEGGRKKRSEKRVTRRCDKSNKDIPTKRLDGDG
jgi:hypothetical protein